MDRFRIMFTLVDNPHPERCRIVHTDAAIAAAEQSIEEEQNESNRHSAQQLHPLYGTFCFWFAGLLNRNSA